MSLRVTEDTPADMLAGFMDLNVVLPSGQAIRMSIQRSMPMMDLLVQVTTAHRLVTSDYSIEAIGGKGTLPYKPSTPIGALEAFTIKIVHKKSGGQKRAPQVPQSFLNSFRLQVHLPRSQLFVTRITPEVSISGVLNQVCNEKNLDVTKYELRNAANLNEILDPEKSIGEYKVQEVTLTAKGNATIAGLLSSADIISVKSSRHTISGVYESSLSSGSLGSRSISPVPAVTMSMPPQPPIRKKRRPAPKPPQINSNEQKNSTSANSVVISHSRESSDSSGYHEALVSSESPVNCVPVEPRDPISLPDSLQRRKKLPPSQSLTNLSSIRDQSRQALVNSISNSSLSSNGVPRKKRAPPPPPQLPRSDGKVLTKSSTLPTSHAEERQSYISQFPPRDIVKSFEAPIQTKVETPVIEAKPTVDLETKVDNDSSHEKAAKPTPKPRTITPDLTSVPKIETICRTTSEGEIPAATRDESDDGSEIQTHVEGMDGIACNLEDEKEGKEEELNFVESEDKHEDTTREPSEAEMPIDEPINDERENSEILDRQNETGINAQQGLHVSGKNFELPTCDAKAETSEEGDSLDTDWQYQLPPPPPPVDFRDTSTDAVVTDFDPPQPAETLETHLEAKPKQDENKLNKKYFDLKTRLAQNKCDVMTELTNVLEDNEKFKLKSLSYGNLYSKDLSGRFTSLNYSRSFSTEPISTLRNFKITTYNSANKQYMNDDNVAVKNTKNLEKSFSTDCIASEYDGVFVKPVAIKKSKPAKRSSSSAGGAASEAAIIPQEPLSVVIQNQNENVNVKDKEAEAALSCVQDDKIEISRKSTEPKEILEVEVAKPGPTKASLYRPPSVNFGTWGERPRTRVVIKDEDYITHEKVLEKEKAATEVVQPKEIFARKPAILKKPGLSKYEMFSALPRRKEITSLELIRTFEEEEEEGKRKNELVFTEKTNSVIGKQISKDDEDDDESKKSAKETKDETTIEKKKETIYLSREDKAEIPSVLVPSLNEKSNNSLAATKYPTRIHLNGKVEPKRNALLMPVVKGFRPISQNIPESHVNNSSVNNNTNLKNKTLRESSAIVDQKDIEDKGDVPIPPPLDLVKLKPAIQRKTLPVAAPVDSRNQLLDEIRNFGGLKNLKKQNYPLSDGHGS